MCHFIGDREDKTHGVRHPTYERNDEVFDNMNPISLNMDNLATEKVFNMLLKLNKHIIDIRFVLE
jgi:hypothetical protein